MQEETGKANNIIHDLLQKTNKGIFIYDLQARKMIFINTAFEEIIHVASSNFKNDPELLMGLVHPEDREYLLKNIGKLTTGQERGVSFEFRIIDPSENQYWICASVQILNEGHNNYVGGFVEDVTKSKKNLMNAKKFAAKKNSILEILAHDLAGPLSNISVVTEMLTEHGKAYNDPDFDKMVGIIARTSERSVTRIREFVKQEFLESSGVDVVKKRVDLVQVLYQIIDQYQNSQADIAKKFSLNSNQEKIFIEIDDYKFSQVINNLISNSIKFTHDGGKIDIYLEQKESVVLITISDDGIGIPDTSQEELFERFTKVRRPGLKGEPSVGLGMSVIKTIVEWHQGRIWFESEVNKGTTFYIELPL